MPPLALRYFATPFTPSTEPWNRSGASALSTSATTAMWNSVAVMPTSVARRLLPPVCARGDGRGPDHQRSRRAPRSPIATSALLPPEAGSKATEQAARIVEVAPLQHRLQTNAEHPSNRPRSSALDNPRSFTDANRRSRSRARSGQSVRLLLADQRRTNGCTMVPRPEVVGIGCEQQDRVKVPLNHEAVIVQSHDVARDRTRSEDATVMRSSVIPVAVLCVWTDSIRPAATSSSDLSRVVPPP